MPAIVTTPSDTSRPTVPHECDQRGSAELCVSSIPSRSALSREGAARVLALIARSLGTLSARGAGGGEHDVGDRLDCTLIASAWRWFCAVDEALDDGQRLRL